MRVLHASVAMLLENFATFLYAVRDRRGDASGFVRYGYNDLIGSFAISPGGPQINWANQSRILVPFRSGVNEEGCPQGVLWAFTMKNFPPPSASAVCSACFPSAPPAKDLCSSPSIVGCSMDSKVWHRNIAYVNNGITYAPMRTGIRLPM